MYFDPGGWRNIDLTPNFTQDLIIPTNPKENFISDTSTADLKSIIYIHNINNPPILTNVTTSIQLSLYLLYFLSHTIQLPYPLFPNIAIQHSPLLTQSSLSPTSPMVNKYRLRNDEPWIPVYCVTHRRSNGQL